MLEIILWTIAAVAALGGVLLLTLFLIARNRPEWLQGPLEALRKIPWMRKKIDSAAAQALAEDSDALLEELPGEARRTLEKSLRGRSPEERARLFEEVQQLAEEGRMEDAARALQARKKDPRQKSKEVQRRRAKKKAARRARKRR